MTTHSSHIEQAVAKLKKLPPKRVAEVEDFIDFLRQRDRNQQWRRDFSQASETAFHEVWVNDEDAVYDDL